jgi:hypothetical protein
VNAAPSPAQHQRMWDEFLIRDLAIQYADSVLTRDGDRLRSLWARDQGNAAAPDFDYRWPERYLARFDEFGATMLHVTTHWIEFVDQDHARGRVQCLVQFEFHGEFADQTVLYEDDYVRDGDGWKFVKRGHRLWFGARRSPDPLTLPAANWPAGQLGHGDLEVHLRRLWQENAGEAH